MPALDDAELTRAHRILGAAGEVLVLTGAGISADSGVPTFRGESGLWKRNRPEELATPEAFARDPCLVWEWYGWRRAVVSACEPNAAHRALARWATRREGIRIVTQNVDGLHIAAWEELRAEPVADDEPAADRAPAEPRGDRTNRERAGRPLELHGSLFRVRCTACGLRRPDRHPVDAGSLEALPRCGRCGALLRPDVVWFGEALPDEVLSEAVAVARRADACLAIGTSAVVQPAAGLASTVAARGGDLVEVNPEPTPLTRLAAASLRAGAADAVPRLLEPEG